MKNLSDLTEYLNEVDDWSRELEKIRTEARKAKNALERARGNRANENALIELENNLILLILDLKHKLKKYPSYE